jgi:2,4-dienoyl-CoA reductase-like NADH-dependent reductase (Old Yellow Enzyme family)
LKRKPFANRQSYLPEQFLSSNVNIRTDAYGGSPKKRCEFTLELMDALAEAVGEENTALRLTPFGLYNQSRGMQRMETWSHLCTGFKARHPGLSYVSFIEPVSFSSFLFLSFAGAVSIHDQVA